MFRHSQDVWTQSVWILLRSNQSSDPSWWKSHPSRFLQVFFKVYPSGKETSEYTKWMDILYFQLETHLEMLGVFRLHRHVSLPDVNLKEVWCVMPGWRDVSSVRPYLPIYLAKFNRKKHKDLWRSQTSATCVYRYSNPRMSVFIHTQVVVFFDMFVVSPSLATIPASARS